MPGKAASKPELSSAAPGLWARAALLCLAVPLAFALGDWLWRSGLAAAWDELGVHTMLQQLREGASAPLGFGRGPLHLAWLSWGLELGAGPVGLRVPVLLGLGLEAWLLWRLARRAGGEAAAFGALAVHAFSRLTWLRLFSVLGFSLYPLWVLLAVTLAVEARGLLLSAAGGLLAGLLLCDYEAGPLALPAIAVVLWRRKRSGQGLSTSLGQSRGRDAAAYALGLGLALLAVLWLSRGQVEHWLAVRGASLRLSPSPWWREGLENLGGYFLGWPKPVQSLGAQAAFAPWALPLLVLGLLSLDLPLALLLALGLLPLIAPAPGAVESHRAAVAWPALCVAAGLGLARVWTVAQRLGRSRLAAGLLGALLALGAWQAAAGFAAARRAHESDAYDYSLRLLKAVRVSGRAQAQGRNGGLLTELNYRSMAAARLLRGEAELADAAMAPAGTAGASAAPWVLLSGEQVGPRPKAAWGKWWPLRQPYSLQALWLLQPVPADAGRWQARSEAQARRLAHLDPLGWPEQLRQVEAELRAGEQDAFLRSALIDRCLLAVDATRAWPPSLLALVAAQPDLSARQCLAVALALRGSDLPAARRFAARAVGLDPSRAGARRLLAELNAERP